MDWNIAKVAKAAVKADEIKQATLQRLAKVDPPWKRLARKGRSKALPPLYRKRSSKNKSASAPSRQFSTTTSESTSIGLGITGLEEAFEFINAGCEKAALTNAPDPVAFLAEFLHAAADKRDAKLALTNKQDQEHRDVLAVQKAREQRKHLEALKAKRMLLHARRQHTIAFTIAFRKWPVEVAANLLRKYKVYFGATRGIAMVRNLRILRRVAQEMNENDFDPREVAVDRPKKERAHVKWKRAAIRTGKADPDVLRVLRGFLTLLGYTDEMIHTVRPTASVMDWGCMAVLLKDPVFFKALGYEWLPASMTRTRMVNALKCVDGIEWRISHVNKLCDTTHGPLALKALAFILTTAEAIGAETSSMYSVWGRIIAPTMDSAQFFGSDYQEVSTMSILPYRNKHELPIRDHKLEVEAGGQHNEASGLSKDVEDTGASYLSEDVDDPKEMAKEGEKTVVQGYGKIKCIVKWSQDFDRMREIDANILAIDWNGDIRDTVYHFKPTLFCKSGRQLTEEEVKALMAKGTAVRRKKRRGDAPFVDTLPTEANPSPTQVDGENGGDERGPSGDNLMFAAASNHVLPAIPTNASSNRALDDPRQALQASPPLEDIDARPTTAKSAKGKRVKTVKREKEKTAKAAAESAMEAEHETTEGKSQNEPTSCLAEDGSPNTRIANVHVAGISSVPNAQTPSSARPLSSGRNKAATAATSNAQVRIAKASDVGLLASTAQTTTWMWDERFLAKCSKRRIARATKKSIMKPSKPDIIMHAEGYMFDLDQTPAEVAAYALVINAPVQTESLLSCQIAELEFYNENDEWITGYPVDVSSIKGSECVLGFVQRKEIPRRKAQLAAAAAAARAREEPPVAAAAPPSPSPPPPSPPPLTPRSSSPPVGADAAVAAAQESPHGRGDGEILLAKPKAAISGTGGSELDESSTATFTDAAAAAVDSTQSAPSSVSRADMFTVADFCNTQFQELYIQKEQGPPGQICARKFMKVRRNLGHAGLLSSDGVLGWEIHAACLESPSERWTETKVEVNTETNFTHVLGACQEHMFENGLYLPHSAIAVEAQRRKQEGLAHASGGHSVGPLPSKQFKPLQAAPQNITSNVIHKLTETSRRGVKKSARKAERQSINPFLMQAGDGIPIPPKNVFDDLILGVGWDPEDESDTTKPTDLDLTVFAYKGKEFHGQVDFGAPTGIGGLEHHGDSQDGAGDGDDERVTINLGKLDEGVSHLFIVLTLFQGGTFRQLKGISARLLAKAGSDNQIRTLEKEVCRYDAKNLMSVPAPHNTLLIGHIKLDDEGWMFHGAHMSTQGQTQKAIHDLLYPHMSLVTLMKVKSRWLDKHREMANAAQTLLAAQQMEEKRIIEMKLKKAEMKRVQEGKQSGMMGRDGGAAVSDLVAHMFEDESSDNDDLTDDLTSYSSDRKDGRVRKSIVNTAEIDIPAFFVPKKVPERAPSKQTWQRFADAPKFTATALETQEAVETQEKARDSKLSKRLSVFATRPQLMEDVMQPRSRRDSRDDEASRTAIQMMNGIQDLDSALKQLNSNHSQPLESEAHDHNMRDALAEHLHKFAPNGDRIVPEDNDFFSVHSSAKIRGGHRSPSSMSSSTRSSNSKSMSPSFEEIRQIGKECVSYHGHDDVPDKVFTNHEWVVRHYKKGEPSFCEICIRLQPKVGARTMIEETKGGVTRRALCRTDPVASLKQNHLKDPEKCHQRAMECRECELRICSFCDMWNWDHVLKKIKKDAQYDSLLFNEHFGKDLIHDGDSITDGVL